MTKRTSTTNDKMPKIKKPSAITATDRPFTVKFGLFLALLTTFVLPVALMSPLILAKMLGFPLIEYIGMTADNFGIFVLATQTIGLLISFAIIAKKLKKNGSTWSAVGLKKFKLFKGIRYIIGYYVIILGLMIALASIAISLGSDQLPTTPNNETSGAGMLKIMGSFWLTFVLSVILAPIIEEIVFRGILFPAMKQRFGLAVGILGSSLIFTLIHINPIQMISVLPLAIYLAIMYQRTGSIYPGIILHATWNLLVLLIAQFSLQT